MFCTLKGLCGIFLVVVGSLGHFLALPFCDLTLIACNSSSAVIMNVFISVKFLGEKFKPRYDVTAMTLVFLGTLIIVLLSNKEQQTFTVDRILNLMSTIGSITYFSITLILSISIHLFMPTLLKKLRQFESDCESYDARSSQRGLESILPKKERATDDAEVEAERTDRDLIKLLYGLPRDSVREVSPDSLGLKTVLKVPMLIFATAAAMISSISELMMKLVGCILKDAEKPVDYLWLLLFLPILIGTATRTLVYVNYGIKYYEQLEVMPIY